MRILTINPGASWSTFDVYNGYRDAWQAAGHTIVDYALDKRVLAANSWLHYQWRNCGKAIPQPTENDVLYLASMESVIKALAHDVDWVVVFAGRMFHPGVFHALRKAGWKGAMILTESPYEDERQLYWASLANVAFTNERTSVGPLSQYNEHVYYLPHAYDPARHHVGNGAETSVPIPSHDAVFVGTDWPERVETFAAVNWEGIDFGLYGLWHRMGSRHHLRRYLRDGLVDNAVTAALYQHAAIGLNPYRQSVALAKGSARVTTAESLNPRAVELAACGCFSISDYHAESKEVFGDLVPTYRTPAELEGLIRYYLAHPEERAAKAAELPERVKDRTFAAQGQRIIETLEAYRE